VDGVSAQTNDVQVRKVERTRLYEAVIAGDVVGSSAYELAGGKAALTHSFVDPDRRAPHRYAYQEIVGAGRLGLPIREAFADLRQQGDFALLDQVFETGESVSLRDMPFELGDHPSERERFSSTSMSKISLGDEECLLG
jgi:hypothetical protein